MWTALLARASNVGKMINPDSNQGTVPVPAACYGGPCFSQSRVTPPVFRAKCTRNSRAAWRRSGGRPRGSPVHASREQEDESGDPYAAAVARLDSLLATVGSPMEDAVDGMDAGLSLAQCAAFAFFPAAVEASMAGLLSCLTGLVSGGPLPLADLQTPSAPQALLALAVSTPALALRCASAGWADSSPRLRALLAARRTKHEQSARRARGLPPLTAAGAVLVTALAETLLAVSAARFLTVACNAIPGVPNVLARFLGPALVAAASGHLALVDELPEPEQCRLVAEAARSADRYYRLIAAEPGGRGHVAEDGPAATRSSEEACRAFRAVVFEWFRDSADRAMVVGWSTGLETLSTLLLWQYQGPSALAVPVLTGLLDLHMFGQSIA